MTTTNRNPRMFTDEQLESRLLYMNSCAVTASINHNETWLKFVASQGRIIAKEIEGIRQFAAVNPETEVARRLTEKADYFQGKLNANLEICDLQ